MKVNLIWNDLGSRLKKIENINQQNLIIELKNWSSEIIAALEKRNNQALLGKIKVLGLDYYTALDVVKYNFNADWENWDELIRKYMFENRPPSTMEGVMMLVRDLLHNLLVYKTTISCPNCDRDELRCYSDGQQIYFECDNCLHFTNRQLEKVKPAGVLKPATRDQLESAGLLRK